MTNEEEVEVHWMAEQQMQKEMIADARQLCIEPLGKLADCTSDKMISIFWSCRKENKALDHCIAKHANKEELERRKREYVRWSLANPVKNLDRYLPPHLREGSSEHQ